MQPDATTGPGPPQLLVTKLHAPPVSPHALDRPRLLDRLDAAAGPGLTLVAGPAGFGKSTLLGAWRRRSHARAPGAWVTLDAGDDDPVVLWSHVVAALGTARPQLPVHDLAVLVANAPLVEVALPRLVNALAAAGPVSLVLDDADRVSGASSRETLAWFVAHRPASTHVVLATRTDPSLPLAALRARGLLTELRGDDLRMTDGEAHAFLNGRLGLGLDPDDVRTLVTRTEGWPAGLYLAALSLTGHTDPSARVRAFDGTAAHIVDYLSTEVLATYPAALQTFMLRVSVMDRMCGALCDAVLGATGSGATLTDLARTNLFLLPLDDRREWFRFHHLFGQLLRVELHRREPGMARTLHRRAARWHTSRGATDDAIAHALAGEDPGTAADLVAGRWVGHVNAGRTASVAEWLDRLPAGVVARDPRLLVVRAWTHALRGRQAEMRAAIDAARALGGLDDGPLPDGFASLRSSVAVLSAAFGWGDARAMIDHGTVAAGMEGPGSPWRPVVAWALGWGLYCAGDMDAAERWLTEAAETAPASGQWVVGTGAIADLSIIAGMRGDPVLQVRLAEDALAQARRVGLADAREVGEVHTAHGLALARRGAHADALDALERGVFLRRLWGQPLDLLDGLIALAPAATAADPARGRALTREAARLARGCRGADGLGARLAAIRAVTAAPASAGSLSDREQDVLRLLGGNLSEREIAAMLSVSYNTVHSHVKAVYRKLGVSTRPEAVARAREAGLLP